MAEQAIGCRRCGLVQALPDALPAMACRCRRCQARLAPRPGRRQICAVLALAGLMLWPAAMFLPVMTISRFGHRSETGVVEGALLLFDHGAWLIGTAVLLASVVLPPLKLAGLLAISLGATRLRPGLKVAMWHLIEWTGRWGMLDVMLVAVLVAAVKIGDLARIDPGSGAAAFTIMVLLGLAAAAVADPQDPWRDA